MAKVMVMVQMHCLIMEVYFGMFPCLLLNSASINTTLPHYVLKHIESFFRYIYFFNLMTIIK
jgi:hypothetical protein